MKRTVYMAAVLMAAVLFSGCSTTAQAETSAKTEVSEAANRLEAIKEKGYMEVVMEPYLAPFEFIDPSKKGDEMYVGADVELAKYIADQLGVECRIIPLDFATVLSSITEGKYDMAISGLAYTPARAEAMEMSKGYFYGSEENLYGIILGEELSEKIRSKEDLKELTVVVQSGSIQELFAAELPEGCGELKRVSATTDGYLMVQEGKADVCITAIKPAELYIEANPDCGLCISPYIDFEVDEELQGSRICMEKGETELLNAVNDIIDGVLESGIYEEWYEEYSELAASLGV